MAKRPSPVIWKLETELGSRSGDLVRDILRGSDDSRQVPSGNELLISRTSARLYQPCLLDTNPPTLAMPFPTTTSTPGHVPGLVLNREPPGRRPISGDGCRTPPYYR